MAYMNRHEKVGEKWIRIKGAANPCPECNSQRIWLNDSYTYKWKRFFVECADCHWCARSMPTIRLAIRAWNKDGGKKYAKMLKRVYGGK